jgi:high-affinity K+ transport system ATPase subunit B
MMNLKDEVLAKVKLSKAMANTSAISGIVIALIFTSLWISALIPLMKEHNRIEFLYSIYLLYLCFVMPAFLITGVMALQK